MTNVDARAPLDDAGVCSIAEGEDALIRASCTSPSARCT
jgi:hypothetical protein